jgi:hypothetical protein
MWTLCRKGETSSGFEEVARCGDLASLRPCQFKSPLRACAQPSIVFVVVVVVDDFGLKALSHVRGGKIATSAKKEMGHIVN